MTTDRTRDDRDDETFDIDRRTFIAAGGTVGATTLAGCAGGDTAPDGSSDAPDDEETDGETDGPTATADGANFRLLISDRPADISDFDRLDVSFDNARIFDGGSEGSSDGDDGADGDGNESAEDAETDGEQTAGDENAESGTETDASQTDEEETADDEDDGASTDGATDDSGESDANGGESDANDSESDSSSGTVERRREFYWLDLEGATVDLTTVVGDRAISVFEGGLSAGTYEKIELHVADVEGVVDGEIVDVKIPSEKLQITHSFEVRADEPLEFVFDINVVEKGNGGYNLKPVISESGVAGKDVDVEEVDEDDDEGDRDEGSNGDGSESDGSDTEESDETESGANEGNESDGSDANP